MKYVDPSGHIAIVPLLLKAGAGGTADLMLQIFVNRYFNPEVSNVQEALGEVNWWQVTRSAGEGEYQEENSGKQQLSSRRCNSKCTT